MKRLGIFFFYDRDGIVDRYIPYMLSDLCNNLNRLVVVVNGKLTADGRKVYEQFATPEDVLVRENKGLDVWAYKTALEHVGFDHLGEYDEVIMMNHTMMGPVVPFRNMFDTMKQRNDLDFWGLTRFLKTDFDPFGTMPDGYIPEHIQSYFIVVRKQMAVSKDFCDYWEQMPMITGYVDSVSRHEAHFTGYFESLGYKWDTYIDESAFRGITYNPIQTYPREMMEKYHCPIFKRRVFMQDYNVVLNETCGENAVRAYDYICNQTDYDTDLIWDNLFRLENMADLKKNMQWNYFLPADIEKNGKPSDHLRTALFMHIYFDDTIDECRHYAESMPQNADIYITTGKESNADKIREKFAGMSCGKLSVKVVPNRGRDVGPFLVEVQNHLDEYDVICHAHDKKAGQVSPGSIGVSFGYRCFENVLSSKEYVENILDIFEQHKRAGILMPPPPNHGDYYITLGWEWSLNFGNTKKLLKKLGINAPIREDKEPIAALGSYFWIRTDALRPMFANHHWSYEDFPEEPLPEDGTLLHALERAYPFAAQSAGYYSGWVMTEQGSAMEVTNLNQMIRELNKIIFFKGQDAGNFNDTRTHLSDAYSIVNHHPYQKKWLHYYRILKSGPKGSMQAFKRHWRKKHDS